VTVQPELQHTPSTQLPFAHSVGAVQATPFCFLHAPAPSQAAGATQVPRSVWPTGTSVQVPTDPATLHAMQVPVHARSQQPLSKQTPEPHSAPAVHAAPSGFVH
jgi:hypothetical protein